VPAVEAANDKRTAVNAHMKVGFLVLERNCAAAGVGWREMFPFSRFQAAVGRMPLLSHISCGQDQTNYSAVPFACLGSSDEFVSNVMFFTYEISNDFALHSNMADVDDEVSFS